MKTFIYLLFSGIIASSTFTLAAAPGEMSTRDRQIRDRYETVLLRNPFQKRAFDRVYESYSQFDGVDAWIERIKPQTEGDSPESAAQLILGQIYDRQFQTADAIKVLEAAGKDVTLPAYQVLLGSLYYKSGRDQEAIKLLGESLDAIGDPDERIRVSRLLGNLLLRQGKRDEAIATWKRITEQNPNDVFSQLELAGIYEDNHMWDEAIAVFEQVIKLSPGDPYRQCRSLRSIGAAHLSANRHAQAIASYEQALGMVAPGNWLFEDLKGRLIAVYQDIGDLAGLVNYIEARLAEAPNDLDYRDLLAETHGRMGKLPEAEKEYQFILERNPRSAPIFEKLISLYTRMERPEKISGTYEKLIELFPRESDYIRRLGEYHLRSGDADQAKKVWQRIVANQPTAQQWSELAGWYEAFEFPDEAIGAYEKALSSEKNKEWTFRLAALQYQKGEEDDAKKLWLSALTPESNADEHAEVATILESHKFPDDAARLLQQAIKLDTNNFQHRLSLAQNFIRRDKAQEALEHFEFLAAQDENEYLKSRGESGRLDAYAKLKIIDSKRVEWEQQLAADPKSSQLMTQLAQLYERSGKRDQAIGMFERRVELDPDNNTYQRDLANAYKRARKFKQAIDALKELTSRDKTRARAYHKDLLDLYLGIDSKDDVLRTAKEIVSLTPADPESRLELAQVYAAYGEPKLALEQYRHALRLEAEEPEYHRAYGIALRAQGRFGEAQEAFRKMLETAQADSTRISAVEALTDVYLQRERLEELIDEFRRNIRLTPKKHAAYENLAVAYKRAGQLNKSIEVLESALANADDREPALKSLIAYNYEATDFAKVRNYYEQLLAQQGQPTAFEYEKLGRIYAQLGEIKLARETWNKMTEADPDDPKILTRMASVMRSEGFIEEAMAAMAKAVELDPYNYKRRYDYAQTLGANDQFAEAVQEIRTILKLGARPLETDDKKSGEKKPRSIVRRGAAQMYSSFGAISPYTFLRGMSASRSFRYSRTWSGNFEQFRPQLLAYLVHAARQSIGDQALVESYTKQLKEDPKNTQLLRDLAEIHKMHGNYGESAKVTQQLMSGSKDDPKLALAAAAYHANEGKEDKALEILNQLADTDSPMRQTARVSIIALHLKNNRKEEADQAIDKVLGEGTNADASSYMSIASFLAQHGRMDQARKLFTKAAELQPSYQPHVQQTLAHYEMQSATPEQKARLYRDYLLQQSTNNTLVPTVYYGPSSSRTAIYAPKKKSSNSIVSYGSNNIQALPRDVAGYHDYYAGMALKAVLDDDAAKTKDRKPVKEPIVPELLKRALALRTTSPKKDRDHLQRTSRVVLAYLASQKRHDEADQFAAQLIANGFNDITLFNIRIYLLEKQGKFDAMDEVYRSLAKADPTRANDTTLARAQVALFGKQFKKAGEIIRQVGNTSMKPKDLIEFISQIKEAGETDLAQDLLEDHLKRTSRTSEALAMLAKIHDAKGETAKAISRATEAWDRKIHGKSSAFTSSSSYFYSSSSSSRARTSANTDTLLADLYKYHRKADSTDRLITLFEQRLRKQPGSIRLHENMAQLYGLNNDRDKALKVFESLCQKRPNLLYAQLELANLYVRANEPEKAKAIYDKALVSYPRAYERISWQLRSLYEKLGQGKELAKLEKKMVSRMTDVNQMRNMARRFYYDGKYEQAIELYRKALRQRPFDSYTSRYLAEALVKAGRHNEAIKVFEDWLNAPINHSRGSSYVDVSTVEPMVGLYHVVGRLDELIKKAGQRLKRSANDKTAEAILGFCAFYLKDFDLAYERFQKILKGATSGSFTSRIQRFAEVGKNPGRWLKLLEDNDLMKRYISLSTVDLYMAIGDREGALKRIEFYHDYYANRSSGSSSYYLRSVLDKLCNFGLWEAAESYAATNRLHDFSSSSYARYFDDEIAEGYAQHNRFTNLVNGILAKDKIVGRDADLIEAITRKLRNQDRDKKITILSKLIEQNPKDHKRMATLGRTALAGKRYSEAIAAYRDATRLQPTSLPYHQALKDALLQSGRTNEAIRVWRKFAANGPTITERQLELAALQAQCGQFAVANETYRRTIKNAKGKKAPLLAQWAKFEREQGRPSTLEKLRAGALKRTPKAKGAVNNQFNHFIDSGQFDQAHEFIGKHPNVKLSRANADVLLSLGNLPRATEYSWNQIRFASRSYQKTRSESARNSFTAADQTDALLAHLLTRISEETNPPPFLLQSAAKIAADTGRHQTAVELCRELLKDFPFEQSHHFQLAASLRELRRTNETLDVLRQMPGDPDLRKDALVQHAIATNQHAFGLTNEAENTISNLFIWASSANLRISQAFTYIKQKRFAEATNLLHPLLVSDSNRRMVLPSMIQCSIALNDHRGALDYARQAASLGIVGRQLNDLKQWLNGQDPELLVKLMPEFRKLFPTDARMYSLEAWAWIRKGDTNRAIVVIESAFQHPANVKNTAPLLNHLVKYVDGRRIEPSIADYLHRHPDSPLIELMVDAFEVAAGRGDDPDLPAHARLFREVPVKNTALALTVAGTFAELEQADAAEKICRPLLSSDVSSVRKRAAVILIRVGRNAGTENLVAEWLETSPSDFIQDSKLLASAARGIDRAKFLAAASKLVPFKSHNTYYEFILDYHTDKREATVTRMSDLLKLPDLRPLHLSTLARLAKEANRPADAIAAHRRLADSGFRRVDRDKALGELVSLYADAGEWDQAVEAFLDLAHLRHSSAGHQAADTLYARATPDILAPYHQRLQTLAAKRPDNIHLTHLIAFYAELSEKSGQPVDCAKLAAELNTSPDIQRAAGRWNQVIENWEITESYPMSAPWVMKTPVGPRLKGVTNEVKWIAAPETATAGFVSFGQLLDRAGKKSNSRLAFARTTIRSAEARNATFNIGASDFAKVWINNRLVFNEAATPLLAAPMNRRFHAELKAGDNAILVKVGNQQGNWRFCLSQDDGGSKLQLTRR